jgi:hypothetical protein
VQPLPGPSPRWAAAAAYDEANDVVILFGGLGPGGLADTWAYRNNTWVQLHPRTSPPARGAAALAWDGHELVLFGGVVRYGSSQYLDDTWTWDGLTWTARHPLHKPAARMTSGAYDGATATIFGGHGFGAGYGGSYGDTWTWDRDAEEWVEQHPRTSPNARGSTSMTYDPALGAAILQGGTNAVFHNDTWSFAHGQWRQLSPDLTCGVAAPAAGLASTDTGDLVQLASGISGEPSHTFAWDGNSWARQQTSPAPSPRSFSAMVRNPDGGVLLFGGVAAGKTARDQGGALGDTWTWTGPARRDQPIGRGCRPGGPPPARGGDAFIYDGPYPSPAVSASLGGRERSRHPGTVVAQPWPSPSERSVPPSTEPSAQPAPSLRQGPLQAARGGTRRPVGLGLLAGLLVTAAAAGCWRALRRAGTAGP